MKIKRYLLIFLFFISFQMFSESKILKEEINIVTIKGMVMAYGNAPHIFWLIKTKEGKLYYPPKNQQDLIKGFPSKPYIWIGELKEPSNSMPGLVPQNSSTFNIISWKEVEINKDITKE